MSTPHVLFLTRKFPPSRGGMETFSYELTSRYPEPATVVHYGHRQRDIIWAAPLLLLSAISKRKQTDIIHLGDLVLAPLAPLLKRLTGRPIVATAHALELTYRNSLLKILIQRGLPAIDHIVAVSDYTAELLIQKGVPKNRLSVITHGVVAPHQDSSRQAARAELCQSLQLGQEDCNRPLILTVGRLVKRKGVAWFIENVLNHLSGENPLYLVASDGPERDRIKALAENRTDIRLLGKVDHEQLKLLYAGADIFVMPNIDEPGDAEGFGFVAIEAAINGLPVAASRIEGIPSAIHDGQNGILVTPGDAEGYTKTLNKWLKDPEARVAFGSTSRAYTKRHFNWDDRVTQYKALFATLTRS